MGVEFDGDVSGSGSASWTTSNILFVSADLTTLGLDPRPADDSDHVLRAGWWTLGDEFDIGLGTFEYWRPVVHVNFTHQLWTPDPSGIQFGNPLTLVASRIRWHFAPSVLAHLHVFS
jgi:hypothetical protein